jgi:peptidyl-prolyl cis-trans isomerase B (cyclophilin B)
MTSPYSPAPAPYLQPAPPQERWNVLAIVGFVLAFFVSLGAVICGHIALSQIKRTGERGHGLALAAVILGYVGIALTVLWIVLIIGVFAVGAANGSYSTTG